MATIEEINEKAKTVMLIREKIKELTTYKEKCEMELEKDLRTLGDEKTYKLKDLSVTLSPTITYSLNEEGNKLLNTIPFEDAVWKKTPDFSTIRKDPRFNFKDVIVESLGKTRISFKDKKETLHG